MSDQAQPEEPAWARERVRIGTGFARVYAALAVGVVVVSALDLYADVVVQSGSSTFTRRFGSVWELAAIDRGGLAAFGLVCVVLLVLLLLRAALQPVRSLLTPVLVALLGAACGGLVIGRVGVREPLPDLADGGQAVVAISIMLVVIGGLHTFRLFFGPQPDTEQPVTRPPADPAGGAGTPPT